jgi:flagellin
MSLTINQNLVAQNAARNLTQHYGGLSTSVNRLSSGLRINSAADDAAGLAIRELMRAEVASMKQGIRNANDAISMIQVADGALQIIDEKLIRMKELATQAATGTYNSDQRLIIDSEYQQMASEIQRIAEATKFNGITLLNGNLSGSHDGSSLESSGALKIHFGSRNDPKEDFYFTTITGATLLNLGLALPVGDVASIDAIFPVQGAWVTRSSGISPVAVITAGSRNVLIQLDSFSLDDDLQVFTRSGHHLAGTGLADGVWTIGTNNVTPGNVNTTFITPDRGFSPGAVYSDAHLIDGLTVPYTPGVAGNTSNSYNPGMTIGYSGDGFTATPQDYNEFFSVDQASEDLLIFSVGQGAYRARVTWDYLAPLHQSGPFVPFSIQTQENAQAMLDRIEDAILRKDTIRADLGAMQNRLANTITNLSIQAENLMAAESRISDADVALEMTAFVRNQILTQSAVAMLAQANALPRMALQVIQG